MRDRGWTWSVTVRVCSHEIRGIGRQRTTFRIDLVAPRVGLSPILTHLALGCVCMCVLCGGLGVHASAAADDVLPRSSSLSLSCARDSALRTLSRSAAWRCLLLANLVRLDCPGCVMLWSGAVARARTHTHTHTHTHAHAHTHQGGNNGTDWHEGIANNSTTNSSRRASAEMSFHTSQHDARRVPPAAAAAAMRPEEPPATSLNYGIA